MEEVSLREYIEVLLKRKAIIISITIISMLMAGVISFFILEPVYETRMVLMASHFSDRLQSTQVQGEGIDNILNSLSKLPTMTLETYRQQIKAPRIMRTTITDLGLEEEYDIESLAKAIHLETIKDTNLITIKMQHENAERAAEIINKVGENFVSFVSDKAKEHATTSSKYVETQMEVEKKQLEEALNELKEFLSQPRSVSELEMELEARLTQITEYKIGLTDLEVRQSALKAAIEVAVRESKDTNRVILKNIANSSDISMNNLQLTVEDSATLLRIELAEVESNIDSIGQQINILQQQIEEIQVELQDKKHQERLISQRVYIAENTYDAFVKKYEELRITESSQIGEATITVISRAFPTTEPVGPKKISNMAIAGVLGVMMSIFVAFFLEYWQISSKKKEAISKV